MIGWNFKNLSYETVRLFLFVIGGNFKNLLYETTSLNDMLVGTNNVCELLRINLWFSMDLAKNMTVMGIPYFWLVEISKVITQTASQNDL